MKSVVQLQGENQDILLGVSLIEDCCSTLKAIRDDVNEFSHRIFEHTSSIALKSSISVSCPRISQRQQHRFNVQSNSPEAYFKVAIVIPLLDHLIGDRSFRFSARFRQAARLQALLPSRLSATTSVSDIDEAVTFYNDDLPNPQIIDEELHVWKARWLAVDADKQPRSLQECLKQCTPATLPNIFCLLKIFAVSSCSCE